MFFSFSAAAYGDRETLQAYTTAGANLMNVTTTNAQHCIYGFCFKNVLKKCNTWCINKFSIHYLKHLEKTGKTMGKKVCKMPIKEHIRYWKLNVNKCEMFLKNHSKQCILFNIHSICNYEIRSILGICVSKPQNNVMFWT